MIKNNKVIIGLLTAALTVSAFGVVPAFAEDVDTTIETTNDVKITSNAATDLVIKNGVLEDASKVSGEITIPDTVTSIKKGAFEGNEKITKLVIPGSIKNIDACTFSYMSGLKNVEIGEGVESIAESAFALDINLESINLPSSLKTIGNGAFGKCSSLKSITVPDGITELKGNTFSGCTNLADIKLPSSLTGFALHDFYGTPWLTSAADSNGFVIVNNTLAAFTKADAETVNVPDGVKIIGGGALSFCNIKKVTLPDSVTLIEEGAFQHDTALESINLSSSLKTIENFAFTGCDALKTLELPASLQSVGENSFDFNLKLTGEGANFYELLKANNTAINDFCGWKYVDNNWYYRNPVAKDSAKVRGYIQTGWEYIDGNWYHFDKTGKMEKGFLVDGGETYYLEDSTNDTVGIMRNGWIQIDNNWYYFNTKNDKGTNGAMQKGWNKIDGTWYYFYTDGKMASNTTIDNYTINADGSCNL